MIPLAVVGMSYREGPNRLRARLLELDQDDKGPSRELVGTSAANGVVRLHTCSRVEWVISSPNPAWAAQLLRSALLSRAGEDAKGRDLHLKSGVAAAHYLTRVTLGLDAVAEGEAAVGRQVVKAFEVARKDGTTDRALHAAWRALSHTLHRRRDELPGGEGVGVQTLVVQALKARKLARGEKVVVFGRGEMGKAAQRALERAGYAVTSYSRDGRAKFERAAKTAPAVVVASGAPYAWLELPERTGKPVVVDVGSPPQLKATPGWVAITLDDLLDEGHAGVSDEELARLSALCDEEARRLCEELEKPPPAEALEAIDDARKEFLREQLPGLLEGLKPEDQKRLKASMARFAHTVLKRTRGAAP
ncbi:MAG: hypothetical protein K1X89_02455 [Myxococcaceae bacterium]|nr:hypothetical protein [Myxococcaceae bacterium]